MNARQGALLRELLEATEFRTCDYFAGRLGCSERTVRNDVKVIATFLQHEGFSSQIVGKRGAGMRLVLAQGEGNRLVRVLDESEFSMQPRFERLCQEMTIFACAPGAHTAESLAHRLYTNKQQIQADVRWWQRILAPYGIGLTTGRSIALEGTEWVVRGFVMSVLFSFSARAVKQRIEPWLTGEGVSKHDQGFYERCIDEVQESLGFRFSSNAQWQLTVYLKVVVARIRLGCTISSHASHRALSPYFSDLRVRLERHFGITVSLAEMHLLQDMADCCTWQWSSKLMDQYVPDERAFGIARDIVRALADSFQSEVPPSYVKPLGILVESGLTRRACGFTIKNPNELTVKYDTMDSFCLLSSVLVDVEPVREAYLNGSDYARIALVLLEYLEQVDYQRRYRAGLVVNCGIDMALFGKHRIEKLMSKVRVADIVTEDEIQMECARSNVGLFDRFDFLISFEPLAVDFPSVVVSSTIDERDIERIVASIPLWKSGHEAELPWVHRKLKRGPKNVGVVRGLCDDLLVNGEIDMTYERFVWLFETLSFVKGRTLVLALCCEGVRRTRAVLYQMEGDAHVFGKRCSMAAVLLVPLADRGDLTPATEGFKRLLEAHADIADVADEGDFFSSFPE